MRSPSNLVEPTGGSGSRRRPLCRRVVGRGLRWRDGLLVLHRLVVLVGTEPADQHDRDDHDPGQGQRDGDPARQGLADHHATDGLVAAHPEGEQHAGDAEADRRDELDHLGTGQVSFDRVEASMAAGGLPAEVAVQLHLELTERVDAGAPVADGDELLVVLVEPAAVHPDGTGESVGEAGGRIPAIGAPALTELLVERAIEVERFEDVRRCRRGFLRGKVRHGHLSFAPRGAVVAPEGATKSQAELPGYSWYYRIRRTPDLSVATSSGVEACIRSTWAADITHAEFHLRILGGDTNKKAGKGQLRVRIIHNNYRPKHPPASCKDI